MQNKKKLIELEALRGFAAVVVLIHHFMLAFTPRLVGLLYADQPGTIFGTPLFAFANGSAAVTVFFVLSGFVLTINLFRAQSVWPGIVAAAKRWPRLAATVMIANCFAGALMAFGLFDNIDAAAEVSSIWLGRYYGWDSTGPAEIGKALLEGATTFFSGSTRYNNALWTMRIEFAGSLLAIGCAVVCARLPSARARAAVFAGAGLCSFAVYPYLTPLVVGAWLAERYQRSPDARWPAWTMVAAAPLLLIVMGFHDSYVTGRAEGWYAPLNPLVTASPAHVRVFVHTLGAALLLMSFLRVRAIRDRMSGRFGGYLGFISFALYLVQVPVICSVSCWTWQAVPGTPAVKVMITLGVTVAATVLAAIPLALFDRWWVRKLNGMIAAR